MNEQLLDWCDTSMPPQDDIDGVNKVAHQLKGRLERLDKHNQQALSRPVRFAASKAI